MKDALQLLHMVGICLLAVVALYGISVPIVMAVLSIADAITYFAGQR